MTKPAFASHYHFHAFEGLVCHFAARPDSGTADYEPWRKQLWVHLDELGMGVVSFLKDLHAREPLRKPDFAEGRGHRFANAWSAMVDGGTDEWGMRSLAHLLGSVCHRQVHAWLHKDEDAVSLHARLAEFIERGDITWYDANCLDSECAVTGENLHIEFDGWKPRIGTVDEGDFKPLSAELPPKLVAHHVIDAPSGELLVADWFRIPAFTDATREKDYLSLNSEAGRLATSADYATRLGFMSVMVGNTSPAIVQREGHTIIAGLDEDSGATEGIHRGRVCTDLWWVTAVDREVLTAIVAKTQGLPEARRLVAEHLESHDIPMLKVPKGRLHVYHTATAEDMALFECDAVSTRHVEQLYAVISTTELQWKRRAAPALDAQEAPASQPRRRRP